MPTKIWSVGEEVLAADFQAFLQNQVIVPFANAGARDVAWPAPLEGQAAWLSDINGLTIYDGSAWRPIAPGLPKGHRQGATGGGGTTTSLSYVNLPTPLTLNVAKQRADTWLEVRITGHLWANNPLEVVSIGLKAGTAAAVEIDAISTLQTSASYTVAGVVATSSGLSGTIPLVAQWKVSTGLTATMVGRWSLEAIELF